MHLLRVGDVDLLGPRPQSPPQGRSDLQDAPRTPQVAPGELRNAIIGCQTLSLSLSLCLFLLVLFIHRLTSRKHKLVDGSRRSLLLFSRTGFPHFEDITKQAQQSADVNHLHAELTRSSDTRSRGHSWLELSWPTAWPKTGPTTPPTTRPNTWPNTLAENLTDNFADVL